MKFIFVCSVIFFLMKSSLVFSSHDDFFPENNLFIPHTLHSEGLSEEQTRNIINEFQNIYEPLFKARGSQLKIINNWTSGKVNARAHKKGRTRYVSMYGGMARHHEMTPHAFALVVCHEIGHHIGGAPMAFGGMSAEGQSDYFAATKCMRRWLRTKNLEGLNVDGASAYVKNKCREVYKNEYQMKECVLISQAGMATSRVFALLQRVDMPSFQTPDLNIVRMTNYRHPAAQCRLDTFFQGALCDNNLETPFSMSDPSIGACSRAKGDSMGFRPRCWFKEYEN